MSSKVDEYGLPSSGGRAQQSRYEPLNAVFDASDLDTTSVRRQAAVYRPAFLNEDDAVMACCHHAHEVARAHGAKEVMLDHLVHALARVGSAAAVLEERGINVETLRRESAQVISSEIPVDNTSAVPQLRASKEFNTVMFMAAASASHRDERATGVRDVLEALLKYDPKSRAVRLIKKHAVSALLEDAPDALLEVRSVMDRYAAEVRDLRLAVTDVRNNQLSQGGSMGGALELRLKDVLDQVSAQRTDAASLQRLVGDRLQSVERTVGTGSGGQQLQAFLTERFQMLEKAFENQLATALTSMTKITDRLELIEEVMTGRSNGEGSEITDMFLEQAKAIQRVETGIVERFRAIERSLGDKLGVITAGAGGGAAIDPAALDRLKAIHDRMAVLDKSMSAQGQDVASINQSLDGELEQIRKALVALGHAQQTLSTAIDEWRLNNSGDLSVISNRLAALEKGPGVVPASINTATALPSSGVQPAILERVDRALKSRFNTPSGNS